jgi:hypothetical protein
MSEKSDNTATNISTEKRKRQKIREVNNTILRLQLEAELMRKSDHCDCKKSYVEEFLQGLKID